jgi:hypothetical protein
MNTRQSRSPHHFTIDVLLLCDSKFEDYAAQLEPARKVA